MSTDTVLCGAATPKLVKVAFFCTQPAVTTLSAAYSFMDGDTLCVHANF
ncbi:hypothetical protein [Corallococcus sp. CA047B]|nr:hypothetical protein [Corallococcus sp. CA047B]